MPSPRAVLHDIIQHGLNPAKPHARIASNGRLADLASAPVPEPQLALKKLPVEEAKVEKKAKPVKVEAPKPEEKAPEAPKKAEKKAATKAAEKPVEEKKAEEKPAVEPVKEEKPAS